MIIFAKLNNLKINNPKKMNEEITKKRKRTRSRRPRLPQGHFDALIDHPKPLGLSHEGRGISKIDDKTHFISYALLMRLLNLNTSLVEASLLKAVLLR